MVGDELEIFKTDGLVLGELGTEWVAVADGNGGLR
jgi:hypothetical protein